MKWKRFGGKIRKKISIKYVQKIAQEWNEPIDDSNSIQLQINRHTHTDALH